jgi:hypothetical protein
MNTKPAILSASGNSRGFSKNSAGTYLCNDFQAESKFI